MTGPLTPHEWTALLLSLKVAAASMVVCLPGAVALGWLLARRRFPGRGLVDALVNLPLVLPPVAVGFLLLEWFGRNGTVGRALDSFGVRLAFTWQGAAIASAVMAFPLMLRPIRLAFEWVDPRLEEAAASLGAPPWRIFRTVSLPLARSGLWAGMVLCFARSLGEFGATITFAGNIPGRTQTLALAIHSHGQVPGGEPQAMRYTLIAIVVSLAALVIANTWAPRTSPFRGR